VQWKDRFKVQGPRKNKDKDQGKSRDKVQDRKKKLTFLEEFTAGFHEAA